MTNEYTDREYALAYLQHMRDIPHRAEGEATLIAEVPKDARRILDIGCGDGHLLSLLLAHCPQAVGVGIDGSPTMLEKARERFPSAAAVELKEHNFDDPLPAMGSFDVVASSFAIHHCTDERKRTLYEEIYSLLEPGGVFCNLEHVSSPNDRVHHRFLEAMGVTPDDEDPSNQLLDVETQLNWLCEIGFEDVDCYWKWRELALLVGRKRAPATPDGSNEAPVLDEHPTKSEVAYFVQRLESFNKQQTGRDDFKPLNLVFRAGGEVVAGLKGTTGWGWLYVQILWVRRDYRKRGLGSRLIERAEDEAIRRGCVGCCLSSFSFQAPEFYAKRGYSIFGKIDHYPQDQTLFFLSKSLTSLGPRHGPTRSE